MKATVPGRVSRGVSRVLRDACAVVAAEADVPIAVLVGGIDRVRAVHAPYRGGAQRAREERRERAGVRREAGLARDVDDDAPATRDLRELGEEVGDVARREGARVARPGDVDVGGLAEHVGVEGDGHRLVGLEYAPRAAEA